MDEAWREYCGATDALMSAIKNDALRAERERILAVIDKGEWLNWTPPPQFQDDLLYSVAKLKAAITEGQP